MSDFHTATFGVAGISNC